MSTAGQNNDAEKKLVLENIPAFPPIAFSVLELASQNDVAMRKIAKVIRSDAVFSAQVLRLANSALFEHPQRVASVHRAVTALGLERIQSLALTVATSQYLTKAMRIEELRRCWRHTLACAILCRELAWAASLSGELGYMLGLLHDLGRLGLLVTYPNDYAQMLRDADRDPQSLLDKEHALFGVDHCEAGRRLAELWNLPEEFPRILGRHHDPPSGNELDMLAVVYHGCRLADILGFAVLKPLKPSTVEEIQAALPPQVAGRFFATPEELAQAIELRIAEHDGGAVPGMSMPQPEENTEPVAPEPAVPGAKRALRGDTLLLAALFVAVLVLAAWLYWTRS